MTHFASADEPDLTFAREQLSVFTTLRRQAAQSGISFSVVHAAHSAGTLALPDARFDMVRIGIMLNGNYPSAIFRDTIDLQPVVTLRSTLARVSNIGVGKSVGYGCTWTAQRPSRVGLVPVGYGDGYERVLSNRGMMLVGGRRCPVIGRISMDQTTVDLTGVPNAQEGDEVVLIGRQRGDEITAAELASWAGTISYEMLCGLTAGRIPKRYLREGQVVETCNLLECHAV